MAGRRGRLRERADNRSRRTLGGVHAANPPDGTLSGEYSSTTSKGCTAKRAVTFTRTADVDVTSLPDPAGQPPRVVSPAEALHGRYH